MTLAEAFERFATILTEKSMKQRDYYENPEKSELIGEILAEVADAAQQVSAALTAQEPRHD